MPCGIDTLAEFVERADNTIRLMESFLPNPPYSFQWGNRCLDVKDGDARFADGGNMQSTPIQVWSCFEGNTNQQFTWSFKGHEEEEFSWDFVEGAVVNLQWTKDKSWCLAPERVEGGAGVVLAKCEETQGWDRLGKKGIW